MHLKIKILIILLKYCRILKLKASHPILCRNLKTILNFIDKSFCKEQFLFFDNVTMSLKFCHRVHKHNLLSAKAEGSCPLNNLMKEQMNYHLKIFAGKISTFFCNYYYFAMKFSMKSCLYIREIVGRSRGQKSPLRQELKVQLPVITAIF